MQDGPAGFRAEGGQRIQLRNRVVSIANTELA